jgi:hypothetical protein
MDMKYIIRESRLNEHITNYLDSIFPIEEIHSTHPEEYTEDGSYYEDSNRIEFYIGDYEYGENTCFRWYSCEYFNPDSPAKNICPVVVIESHFDISLNGFFGNFWHEPFKEWFTKNFNLPVKTVE